MPRSPVKLPFAARSLRPTLVLAVVTGSHWAVLGAASNPVVTSGVPPMAFEMRMLSAASATAQPLAEPIRPPIKPTTVREKTSKTPITPHTIISSPVPTDKAGDEVSPNFQVAAATPDESTAPNKPVVTAANAHTPQLPQSVRLLYDIKGEIKRIPISANGELNWRQDGKTYDARLEISIFLLGSRVQTSKGLISPKGLEPVRFGDKVRSEVAAHFERGKGKITYSANTPDEVLQPGAQDQLSIFFQLAGLLAANPERFTAGSSLGFQAVGPRSSETWVFKLAAPDVLTLPGGKVRAIRLSKDPVSEYDSRAELWLAPDMDYLPVRIRLTQGNGDVVDQLWRATERPTANP